MSLKIGIVGLPNVGKSTLFNALVKNSQAEASNYPFCTIDPNVGIVAVPDERLERLTKISGSAKTIPATVEFVDVAGLVAGAHKGEGLGNQFLSHIRECDAIAIVVRIFADKNIVHVNGEINPTEDIKIINLELILSDLAIAQKRLQSLNKETKTNPKEATKKIAILKKITAQLENEQFARESQLNSDEKEQIRELNLITLKPCLFIANVSEAEAGLTPNEIISQNSLESLASIDNLIPISAKIESELSELAEIEQKDYLSSLGLTETGLNRLIKAAYKTLNLETYFTSGEKETRAWTITKGSTAPIAAGKIHTDFEKGFIAADVCKYDDFINYSGWNAAKEKGLVKIEGKTYIVRDGDIVIFKFNV